MSNLPITPVKKPSFLKRNKVAVIVAVAALVVGVLIGGAGKAAPAPTAAPAPAKTVTVEKEVEVSSGAPEVCQATTIALFAMVGEFNTGVAMPYNEALKIIVAQATAVYPDSSEVDRATGLVQSAGSTVQGFTNQMNGGLADQITECVNG